MQKWTIIEEQNEDQEEEEVFLSNSQAYIQEEEEEKKRDDNLMIWNYRTFDFFFILLSKEQIVKKNRHCFSKICSLFRLRINREKENKS